MTNQVIIIHDLATGVIQIGKAEQQPVDQETVVLQDLDSIAQALRILIGEADRMGVCPAGESLKAVIEMLQKEFPIFTVE
jgi:hypothetical protein